MAEDRTLDIRVNTDLFGGSTRTKHFNVDNVAFFRAIDIEITAVGWALVGGVGLSVFGILAKADHFSWGIIAGAIAAGMTWWWLYSLDGADIGALTETTKLATRDLDNIERSFAERSTELISIIGERPGVLRNHTYRHHFVPDNIVSIEHVHNDVGLSRLFSAGTALGLALLLPPAVAVGYGWTPTEPDRVLVYAIAFPLIQILAFSTVYVANNHRKNKLTGRASAVEKAARYARIAAVAVVLTVVITHLAIAMLPGGADFLSLGYVSALVESFVLSTTVLLVYLAEQSDEVALTLQSGEDKTFVMATRDAREVVQQFSSR